MKLEIDKVRIIENVVLPVSLLWDYREFKRDELPAPKVPFINMYDVEQVTDHIKTYGIKEPLELSIIGNHALLTDGNHRLVAARRNNYELVPVNIHVYSSVLAQEVFYEHTLLRFKHLNPALKRWLIPALYSNGREAVYNAQACIACVY